MTFDEFVAHRLNNLLRFATVVTCDPHLAQDIVQDVLIRAYGRWRHLSTIEQPEAYIRRMVINQYLSWRRRSARTIALDAGVMARLIPPSPDIAGDCGDDPHDLMTRIARLTPKQRAVIAMRYYDDQPDADIARALGCTEGTVRAHASRALAALRIELTTANERSARHDV
jgi:RNA polymerase sigma-70 factor (sigma-E family)